MLAKKDGYYSYFYDNPERLRSRKNGNMDFQTFLVLVSRFHPNEYTKLIKITWGFQMVEGEPYTKTPKISRVDSFVDK
jgi:hypothetical protein